MERPNYVSFYIAINLYLDSYSLCNISEDQYRHIVDLVIEGQKVPAIKFLREKSADKSGFMLNAPVCFDTNEFWQFLQAREITHFYKLRRLGLKEAKQLIEVLECNLEALWEELY